VSDNLQDDVKTAEIGPCIESDHSSVSLVIDSVEDQKYGPSFWKLNTSLLEDPEYVQMINNEYYNWLKDTPSLHWIQQEKTERKDNCF